MLTRLGLEPATSEFTTLAFTPMTVTALILNSNIE